MNKTPLLIVAVAAGLACSTFGCAMSTRNKAINFEEQTEPSHRKWSRGSAP